MERKWGRNAHRKEIKAGARIQPRGLPLSLRHFLEIKVAKGNIYESLFRILLYIDLTVRPTLC